MVQPGDGKPETRRAASQDPDTRPRERRRRELLERNRQEILDVARALVLEGGMEAMSLREVARRADYSPGALYRYFPNKEALLQEIAMIAIKRLGAYLTAVPADLHPRERLIELGLAYMRFAEDNPEQLAVVFNRMVVPETDWRSYAKEAWPFTLVVGAVDDGVVEGAFRLPRGLEPEDFALGVWSTVHGFATLRQAHLKNIRDDLIPYIQALLETTCDAIATDKRSRP
jgi:AcrR family transcriptional regulator